jgi:hypothetical protein
METPSNTPLKFTKLADAFISAFWKPLARLEAI